MMASDLIDSVCGWGKERRREEREKCLFIVSLISSVIFLEHWQRATDPGRRRPVEKKETKQQEKPGL